MSKNLGVYKNKVHPTDVFLRNPFLNMQKNLSSNSNRMLSPFFPSGALISKNNPFEILEQNIYRLFSESFNMAQMMTPWWMGRPTAPYIDIVENGNKYVVYADVPGLSEENIHVSAVENALIIEGRKERHKSADGDHYIHRECHTAPFSRTVALPEDADSENAAVICKHNVLIIEVPKREESAHKSHRLKIAGTEKKNDTVSKLQEKKAA